MSQCKWFGFVPVMVGVFVLLQIGPVWPRCGRRGAVARERAQAHQTVEPVATLVGPERPSRPCLVIIDMQEGFLAGLPSDHRDKLVASHVSCVDTARQRGIPIIATTFAGDGEMEPRIRAALQGSEFTEIVKQQNDGFRETSLLADLQALEVDGVILAGVNASGCVLETAGSAIFGGFAVMVSDDLMVDTLPFPYDTKPWYTQNCHVYDDREALWSALSMEG